MYATNVRGAKFDTLLVVVQSIPNLIFGFFINRVTINFLAVSLDEVPFPKPKFHIFCVLFWLYFIFLCCHLFQLELQAILVIGKWLRQLEVYIVLWHSKLAWILGCGWFLNAELSWSHSCSIFYLDCCVIVHCRPRSQEFDSWCVVCIGVTTSSRSSGWRPEQSLDFVFLLICGWRDHSQT